MVGSREPRSFAPLELQPFGSKAASANFGRRETEDAIMAHHPRPTLPDFSRALADPRSGYELHISALTAAQISVLSPEAVTDYDVGVSDEVHLAERLSA